MMRVLHVTRDFPPLRKGGLSTAVGGMVGALSARGVTCAVLSFDGWRPRARPAGAETTGDLDCTTSGQAAVVARLSSPGQLPAAERFADAFGPDVVHVHHDMLWPFAAGVRARLGAPAVVTVHVLHAEQERLRGLGEPTASGRAQARALDEADLVIAPSRAVAARLIRAPSRASRGGLVTRSLRARTRVIGLGVDDSDAARASAVVGPNPDGPVLYAGRLSDMRGTAELFAAIPRIARAVPTARFVIAGGIPDNRRAEARWLRRLSDAMPADVLARVEVTGWLAPDALEARYARAAVLVAPSWFETFGLAVLEGMLFGVPVAATRAGGLAELVSHDHTGLLCEPRDVDGLVANVCRLLCEPTTARRLGGAAARSARRGRLWSDVLPAQIAVYRTLLSHPRRARLGWRPWPASHKFVASRVAAVPACEHDRDRRQVEAKAKTCLSDPDHTPSPERASRGAAGEGADATGAPAAASPDERKLALPPGGPLRDRVIAAFADVLDYAMSAARNEALSSDVRVHELRKSIRRARSVLRLLDGILDEPDRSRIVDALRAAHRATSPLRDAVAVHAGVDALAADGRVVADVEALRSALEGADAAPGRVIAATLSDCTELVAPAPGWLADALPPRVSWRHLRAGLARSYRRTRRALHAAAADLDRESIHDWRKRTKELGYQLELLTAQTRGKPRELKRAATSLARLLGECTDLAVLASYLDATAQDAEAHAGHPSRQLSEPTRDRLHAAIADAERDRLVHAFAQGVLLLARPPREFARRTIRAIRDAHRDPG